MPEGEIPEGSEPQGGMNPGITLTGEEKTIMVDEDTEYQKTGGNMAARKAKRKRARTARRTKKRLSTIWKKAISSR